MKRLMLCLFVLALPSLFAHEGGPAKGTGQGAAVDLKVPDNVRAILNNYCIHCHNPDRNEHGFDYKTDDFLKNPKALKEAAKHLSKDYKGKKPMPPVEAEEKDDGTKTKTREQFLASKDGETLTTWFTEMAKGL